MKIKKTALVLAALAVISMAGCAKSEAKPEESAAVKQEETDEASENHSEAGKKEASEEKSLTITDGRLVWATNAEFKPYEYVENDKVIGIDAEIAQYIGDRLGLETEVRNINFDSILYNVQNNDVDLGIAAISVDEKRKELVNFTSAYISDSGQVLMVKTDSDIKSAADLKGKKIGVLLGTVGYQYVTENIENASAERYNIGSDAVIALIKDEVDAVIMDGRPAAEFAAESNDVAVIGEPLTEQEEYAIAVNKDNKELLDKVNEILLEMKENGRLDEIKEKYYNQ